MKFDYSCDQKGETQWPCVRQFCDRLYEQQIPYYEVNIYRFAESSYLAKRSRD